MLWSYGSWIYIYLCNQCLSPLMMWVRISIRARCTTLCDKVCHWLATGRWFSPGPPASSTTKTGRYDIAEILLKVVLNTINQSTFIKHNVTNIISLDWMLKSYLTIQLLLQGHVIQRVQLVLWIYLWENSDQIYYWYLF